MVERRRAARSFDWRTRSPARSRIVSICVSGFPGPNRTLTTLAEVSGMVRHLVLADARSGGPQAQFLMHHLETIRPRTVIFGGWSPHYEPFLERARANGPRYVVYWTSSAGQTEMAGELQKYLRIIDDARVAEVLYADVRLARSPAARLTPADFLPVCALPPAKHRRVVRAKPRGARVVSLFFSSGEARRKNPFTAFLALGGLQDKYVLHLNGLSRHAPYRRLLGKLEIPFRDFGWMERAVYERALEDVDLGLQLSFAESYNQVAADHFLRGIPVVVSEMIPLLNNVDPSLRAKLVVSNPDDPTAVREKIGDLLAHARVREQIGAAVRRQLLADNTANVRTARRVLRRLA
jgi:hypothetical protein